MSQTRTLTITEQRNCTWQIYDVFQSYGSCDTIDHKHYHTLSDKIY